MNDEQLRQGMVIKDCEANNNNRAGMIIYGDPTGYEVLSSKFNNNGHAGIEVRTTESIYLSLGLPGRIDPDDLLALYKAAKSKDPEERTKTDPSHPFLSKLKKQVMDWSALLASISKWTGVELALVVQWLRAQG